MSKRSTLKEDRNDLVNDSRQCSPKRKHNDRCALSGLYGSTPSQRVSCVESMG